MTKDVCVCVCLCRERESKYYAAPEKMEHLPLRVLLCQQMSYCPCCRLDLCRLVFIEMKEVSPSLSSVLNMLRFVGDLHSEAKRNRRAESERG